MITSHEKSMQIIEAFGMNAEKIAEVIGKSQNTVYYKKKLSKGNRFTEDDFDKIKDYCLSQISVISKL